VVILELRETELLSLGTLTISRILINYSTCSKKITRIDGSSSWVLTDAPWASRETCYVACPYTFIVYQVKICSPKMHLWSVRQL